MPSLAVLRLDAILSSNNPSSNTTIFSYDGCRTGYAQCNKTHFDFRYGEASATWVLITCIIIFFMKAGFMLVEVAFCREPKDRRRAIVIKHQDAFASAIGFFIIGFRLSNYHSGQDIFDPREPLLWFFKFNFASNAATIVGGCLLRSEYKMRIPAAFISAFVISGIIHPVIARLIWSDVCHSHHHTFSPYRFCYYGANVTNATCLYNFNSTEKFNTFFDRVYILDFAGGGAVHLLGGIAGLILAIFAKIQKRSDHKRDKCCFFKWRDALENGRPPSIPPGAESPERSENGYWLWMYPANGGDDYLVAEAGLGVMILWFCWFAFNCGATESVGLTRFGIPGHIVINMIMAVAAGGTVAVVIAVGVQVYFDSDSLCSNEIANGVLSALVAITAGCPFVDYWAACIIGIVAVLLYHGGCWLEYKLDIEDGARIFPVHGICGFWSVFAVGLFLYPKQAQCNLHATFEGLCYCELRLPHLSWPEHLLAQFLGAVIMLGISAVGSTLLYGFLFFWPVRCFCSRTFTRICCRRSCSTGTQGADYNRTCERFKGGLLLTFPNKQTTRRRPPRTRPPGTTLSESSTEQDTEEPTSENAQDRDHVHPSTDTHGSENGRSRGQVRPNMVTNQVQVHVEVDISSHGTASSSFVTAPTSSRRRATQRDTPVTIEQQQLLDSP